MVKRDFPVELIGEVIEMYEGGASLRNIEIELGIPPSTVRQLLIDNGVNLRSPGKSSILDSWSQTDIDAFLEEYYVLNTHISDLVAKWQLSDPTAVYTILRKLGRKPRRQETFTERHKSRMEMYDLAIKMYEEGFYIWQIEQETGVDQSSFHHELHKRGIPTRRQRQWLATKKLLEERAKKEQEQKQK